LRAHVGVYRGESCKIVFLGVHFLYIRMFGHLLYEISHNTQTAPQTDGTDRQTDKTDNLIMS